MPTGRSRQAAELPEGPEPLGALPDRQGHRGPYAMDDVIKLELGVVRVCSAVDCCERSMIECRERYGTW